MNINERIQELGTMLPKCNEKYALSISVPLSAFVTLYVLFLLTACFDLCRAFVSDCSDLKYNKGLILKETVDYINTLKQSQDNLLSSNASLTQKLQVCAIGP